MGYLLPFDASIKLGQPFGARPGEGPNPAGGHNGDDWLTQVGVPVRAAGDGVVVFAGEFDTTYADNFGWNLNYGGKMVVLNMDGDTAPYFEYGHNSTLLVKTGDRVARGQIIALTGNTDGNTGVISGPHCHVGCLPYNFNLNTNTYGRVNPRIYLTEYWEGGITPQGSTTQEDELSAAEVDAITKETNKQKEDLKEQLFKKIDAAVLNLRQHEDDTENATRIYLKDRIKESSPAEIAAAVPKDIAAEVVKLLTARLAQ